MDLKSSNVYTLMQLIIEFSLKKVKILKEKNFFCTIVGCMSNPTWDIYNLIFNP